MRGKWFLIPAAAAVAAMVVLALRLTGVLPHNTSEPPATAPQTPSITVPTEAPPLDENTFVGKVTRVMEGSMQMDCYDKEKFTTVWVHLTLFPELNPQVGEEYVVTHTGMVMESFPPQVTAEKIAPFSDITPQ